VDLGNCVSAAFVGSTFSVVGDELVEIIEIIQLDRELFSEGISREDGVVTLLVESFDINVGGNVVSLGLCEWEPTGDLAGAARVMNGNAATTKRADEIE
jgi:hypothetical protein